MSLTEAGFMVRQANDFSESSGATDKYRGGGK
jgi:hypothetical protein